MPLNNLYDEQAVIQAIASALETFYGTLIEKIDGLNIQKVMRRKNPYLYRAKAMQSANEIVDSVLTAFVSSSEETIFGNCFFEPIAIAASGGNKALAEGILDQTKGDRLDQIYRELGEEYVDSKEDIEKVHNAMELIKIITEDKTNGFVNKKIQMYTLFCVMFDFSEKKISISQDMVEKLKIFIQCYTLFKNEYEIESESTEEQRTIEYLKKYKLASSEGVNKIGNRMIRFEVLKKVLLQTDGIETDIFEKTARKMEKMNSSEEETDG